MQESQSSRPRIHPLLLMAVAVGLPPFAAGAQDAPRPNVVMILTDDQGYGDLSHHGHPRLRTLHLDRLAAESLRLTDFHVAPMCTPTRGQLLTGRDALANGAMNVSSGRTLLRSEFPTMADFFAASGYRTGLFGKWHLGDNYPYRPQDRGFEEHLWFPSSHIPSAPDFWNNDYFDDTYRHNGRLQQYSGYCTDVFFEEAIRWIGARRDAGEPFFAYIATNAPHGPLFVPDKYREPYRDLPRNVASFLGMIANIDENVGRLTAFLETAGLRDNTILIFLTDNGGTAGVRLFNAGMRGGKIQLYDGGHRVPCFLRWPSGGLKAPGDIDELTHCQDLLPTLIELCGLKGRGDAAFDGVSLAGLLRGDEERLADRLLVVQFSRMNAPEPKHGDAAVLWQKWRLVGGNELYDIAADPAQQTNVASEHPGVVRRMREHYDAWWSRIAPAVNEFSPVHVGSDAENPTMLSPCEWQDVFLDQAAQVRRGERKNGVWNVTVERGGRYEISLRRWPVEADTPLMAGLPEYQAADGVYPAGVALPIVKARLQIGEQDLSRAVGDGDKAVTFELALEAGRTTLQTWFYNAHDEELCGAYYVYVKRL